MFLEHILISVISHIKLYCSPQSRRDLYDPSDLMYPHWSSVSMLLPVGSDPKFAPLFHFQLQVVKKQLCSNPNHTGQSVFSSASILKSEKDDE